MEGCLSGERATERAFKDKIVANRNHKKLIETSIPYPKIGIIGCGTIGNAIADSIEDRKAAGKIAAVFDIIHEKSVSIKKKLKKNKPLIAKNIEEVFEKSDLVVESAHINAVKPVLKNGIKYRKDVFIMSVGGLLKFHSLYNCAKKVINVYYPSGAIVGLDGLFSASCGRIKKIMLITRKPPKAFDLKVKKEKVLFSGGVRDAIKLFPQNINIAASVVLNSESKKICVKIVADPKIKRNIHQLQVEGDFGKFSTITQNIPSKENPKTSKLAIFSAISKLKSILKNVKK